MGASWAIAATEGSRGPNSSRPAGRGDMGTQLLARVRWNNVGIVVLAAGLLALVVAWPVLSPGRVVVPPPVVSPGGSVPAPVVSSAGGGGAVERRASRRRGAVERRD